MNYENMSFRDIHEMIKQKKLLDKNNNYIKQKPKDNGHSLVETFVERTGLTVVESINIFNYALEQETDDLVQKILKVIEI